MAGSKWITVTDHDTTTILKGFNGNREVTAGLAAVEIELDGITWSTSVPVVHTLEEVLILGQDFLSTFDVLTDTKYGVARYRNMNVCGVQRDNEINNDSPDTIKSHTNTNDLHHHSMTISSHTPVSHASDYDMQCDITRLDVFQKIARLERDGASRSSHNNTQLINSDNQTSTRIQS